MNADDKKQLLFNAARKLFLEHGYKKTSIALIAEEADVAVGTFYKYFDSKEQIFYNIYQFENETVKRKIVSEIDTDQPPKNVINQFLETIIQTSSTNEILAEWYNNTAVSQMIMEKNQDYDYWQDSFIYNFLIDNIKQWRAAGEFRQDIELETTISLFNALVVVDNHKEEVGHAHYPQILELLVGMIVDGLSTEQ